MQAIGRCRTCGRACLSVPTEARVGAERRGFEERGWQGSGQHGLVRRVSRSKGRGTDLSPKSRSTLERAAERGRLTSRAPTDWLPGRPRRPTGPTRLSRVDDASISELTWRRDRSVRRTCPGRRERKNLSPPSTLGDLDRRLRRARLPWHGSSRSNRKGAPTGRQPLIQRHSS